MLGRKAGCEGVRTDLSASLAASRHRHIGPARFSPVDCEEAPFSVTFRQLAKQLFRVRGQTSRHTIPAATRHLLRSNILICGRARTSD